MPVQTYSPPPKQERGQVVLQCLDSLSKICEVETELWPLPKGCPAAGICCSWNCSSRVVLGWKEPVLAAQHSTAEHGLGTKKKEHRNVIFQK